MSHRGCPSALYVTSTALVATHRPPTAPLQDRPASLPPTRRRHRSKIGRPASQPTHPPAPPLQDRPASHPPAPRLQDRPASQPPAGATAPRSTEDCGPPVGSFPPRIMEIDLDRPARPHQREALVAGVVNAATVIAPPRDYRAVVPTVGGLCVRHRRTKYRNSRYNLTLAEPRPRLAIYRERIVRGEAARWRHQRRGAQTMARSTCSSA
jgi:hypothetical protein